MKLKYFHTVERIVSEADRGQESLSAYLLDRPCYAVAAPLDGGSSERIVEFDHRPDNLISIKWGTEPLSYDSVVVDAVSGIAERCLPYSTALVLSVNMGWKVYVLPVKEYEDRENIIWCSVVVGPGEKNAF